VTMDIFQTPDLDPNDCESPESQSKSFRWNNVFTGYILSISFTAMQFAGSHDSTYTNMTLAAIFLHLAFETNQSLHCSYSGKCPYYLGIAAITIGFAEAVLVWFESELMMNSVFPMHFLWADTFSFCSALCLLFNKAMPRKIRVMAAAISIHFAMASISLYYIPVDFFYAEEFTIKTFGAAWVMIGVASAFQIYLCRDVIRGELNHIGPVRYDEAKSSKFFILFAKIGSPLMGFVMVAAVAIMGMYSDVERVDDSDRFADWIWDDVIFVAVWPISVLSVVWVLYLRATPFDPSSNKEM